MNTIPKNTITIIAILLIGFGIYYFANEYAVMNPVVNKAPQSLGDTDQSTQNGTTQGKININEVCEGALIRMTFPDGAAADAFVKDCKEGKYPEVIEEYKAGLNLGAGAEI